MNIIKNLMKNIYIINFPFPNCVTHIYLTIYIQKFEMHNKFSIIAMNKI